jgi:phosphatidylserine decarboxylase precursor
VSDRLAVLLQYLLPKKALTAFAGWCAASRATGWTRRVIPWFIQRYGVNMAEAANPDPASYASFNEFFTRPLRPGVRPLADADWVCPVDGAISQFGPIEKDQIFQAKGHHYSTRALVGGDAALAAQFQDGHFATIYLSPKDYHRIHMPCDARLTRMIYVPGDLFSVNPATARGVPGLFARNERVVCVFDTARGPFVQVLVGATIVGTMTTLGTPLVPSATKVMLLGSGELGKEVLIALQRLGVETIAVDRYDHAPGQQVAHHARTITMSDPAQLRALIEAERPHLVVPEIEAIATPMLEELEAAGVVRVIPTARAARLTMDREGIRRLAAETLGLPTSPYKFCDSLAELQAAIEGETAGIGYPCIVKPVMSSSGKGQSKIDGPADVQKAWDYAMAGGRVSHGRVIVEGFIDFDYEITLLTVRAVGEDGNASKPTSANPSAMCRSAATMWKAGSPTPCTRPRWRRPARSPRR